MQITRVKHAQHAVEKHLRRLKCCCIPVLGHATPVVHKAHPDVTCHIFFWNSMRHHCKVKATRVAALTCEATHSVRSAGSLSA